MMLGPVRDAMLAEAHAEARRIEAEAARRARGIEADAAARAAATAAQALVHARARARARGDRSLAEARHRARATVLAARREAFDALARRTQREVAAITDDDPDYAALVERLTRDARARLGGEVTIEAAAGGGIVARAGSRRIDYSLAAQVERALDTATEEIEALWA